MEEKITKKSSIIFNQLWINKVIEEGHIELLPYKKPQKDLSIGEYLEKKYEELNLEEENGYKITKKNSLLFEREWYLKFKEEGLHIPKRNHYTKYSYGEQLALRYFEIEMINGYKEKEKNKCLELK